MIVQETTFLQKMSWELSGVDTRQAPLVGVGV